MIMLWLDLRVVQRVNISLYSEPPNDIKTDLVVNYHRAMHCGSTVQNRLVHLTEVTAVGDMKCSLYVRALLTDMASWARNNGH